MAFAHLHVESGQETLAAVIIGALLAAAGGFLSSRLEKRLEARERERSAAILLGEILSALSMILELADTARSRGDPFGPVTLRVLRAAQWETRTYERNRELLSDIRDLKLRAGLHVLLVRLTVSVDGIFDDPTEAERHSTLDYCLELREEIAPLVSALERLSGAPLSHSARHAQEVVNLTAPGLARGRRAAAAAPASS